KRPAAGFHFALRKLVQNNAGPRRLRTRRLPARGRLRLLRCRGTRLGRWCGRHRRLRATVGPRKLALLGFDDDSLRASMRKTLPHSSLFRALERQRFLRIDAERLVFTSFTISHSISSAAPAAAAAAEISRPSSPRYSTSILMRFSAASPAPWPSTAACITFVAPNAKLISFSEKSLNAGTISPPAWAAAFRAARIFRTPSGDASIA